MTFNIGLGLGLFYIDLHSMFVLVGRHIGNQGMFWRQNNKSSAKNGVSACSENGNYFFGAFNMEVNFGAFAFANPIALHGLNSVAPV